MRDPNRIDIFCQKMAEYWKKVPDWRFGQLISNVIEVECESDPFYVEDDEMLSKFERYFKE